MIVRAGSLWRIIVQPKVQWPMTLAGNIVAGYFREGFLLLSILSIKSLLSANVEMPLNLMSLGGRGK
ncbi:MAG: hypothetical protein DI535_03145 [Citrobacter freundii]|nr:MAG: hypothetical protein DI535_03145 [Citrobacter freundii]